MQGQERDLDETCGSLPTQGILRFCFTFSTYTSNFLHVFSVQSPFLGGRRCHLVFLEKSIFLEKLVFFRFLEESETKLLVGTQKNAGAKQACANLSHGVFQPPSCSQQGYFPSCTFSICLGVCSCLSSTTMSIFL